MADSYPVDPVTLRINDTDWSYWQSVEVSHQIDAIAGSFSLELVERWGDGHSGVRHLPLAAGQPCEILLGMDQVIRGYIDKVEPSFSATAHGIRVSGRDASADMVDCSALHKPGQWSGLTCAQLAEELGRPFGVQVAAEGDVGAPIPNFKLEPGEKAFDALDRALKQRECLACPDGAGGLVILRVGQREAEGRLKQGENILSASLSCDMSQRYSDYVVQGQQPGNDQRFGLEACAVSSQCRDTAVLRYRPLLIKAENSVDAAAARQRAAWEKTVRAARAVTVRVTVQGFRQLGAGDEQYGPLWEINSLVEVVIPYLRLCQRLLVSKVTWRRSLSGGSTTELELRDPAAFTPEPKKQEGKGGKSGAKKDVTVEQEKDIQSRMAADAAAANRGAG